MPTTYTSLLGFALPATGELSGTWGTTVNNSITELVEDSIAATATASVAGGDWTLSTTGSGSANEARCAILIPTGSPGVSRNIIAPSLSKAYVVINQSNAAVVVKGAATTGVSFIAGEKGIVAWNGSDFVKVASSEFAGTLPVTSGGTGQTTYTNGQLLIGNTTGNTLTKATLTAGSGVSITNGTGSITIAATGSGGTVTSVTATAGSGISITGSPITTSGTLTITNTGVTSNVAGTGVSVSGATGAVTISIGQAVATSSNVQFNSIGVNTAGSGTAGEIRATNNITAYYSDDRLKTKLGGIENALDKLCTLSGFYYEANETAQALGYTAVREVGVSAQSVQAILPEVVAPAPIDDKYLTVRYEKLIPLVIEAIKELRAEVKALKGE